MKPPAKTAAERQKAYRERRAKEVGEQRINTWVAAAAIKHLNALAQRHGLTQKVMLERLILAAGQVAQLTVEEKPAEYQTQTKARRKAEKPNKPSDKKTSTRAAPKKPAKTKKAKPIKQVAKAKSRSQTKPAKPLEPPAQASLWDDLI